MVNRRTGKPKAKAKPKAKSRVNEAGNYTKPTMRKRLFEQIKAGGKGVNLGNGVDANSNVGSCL